MNCSVPTPWKQIHEGICIIFPISHSELVNTRNLLNPTLAHKNIKFFRNNKNNNATVVYIILFPENLKV